ncbi:MAG: D-alanyl-D-alanine carboxypeptidase [Ruminococcaceae bacterium]|nr:D-alanyl-D-alanine carboxypeptidase [Oscillospiraceae bacterium]
MNSDNNFGTYRKLIAGICAFFCVFALCIGVVYFVLGEQNKIGDESEMVSTEELLQNNSSKTDFETTAVEDDSEMSKPENSEEEFESVPEVSEFEKLFYLTVPEDVTLYSPNVLVYNLTEQYTVYSKIEHEICAPASLTKMLTALVALDYISYESSVRVGDEIDMIGANSSVAFLQKGSRYKMSTMLEALMLPSGNDAAYSLAVNAARVHANDNSLPAEDAVSDFVRLMNEKAKALGCISTCFLSPDGYDADGQYTTTEDMLLISIAAYSNAYIKECVSKSVNSQHGWYNSNMLIREDSEYYNPCVTGLKTGSTDAAGNCVAVSAEIGDATYIMLFMKSESKNGRFADANTIIELIKEQLNIEDDSQDVVSESISQ